MVETCEAGLVEVRAIEQRLTDDLALCYRRTGAIIRGSGTLRIDLDVADSGAIETIALGDDDFQLPALEHCVTEVFAALDLPAPPEPVRVRYPVRFGIGGA